MAKFTHEYSNFPEELITLQNYKKQDNSSRTVEEIIVKVDSLTKVNDEWVLDKLTETEQEKILANNAHNILLTEYSRPFRNSLSSSISISSIC